MKNSFEVHLLERGLVSEIVKVIGAGRELAIFLCGDSDGSRNGSIDGPSDAAGHLEGEVIKTVSCEFISTSNGDRATTETT